MEENERHGNLDFELHITSMEDFVKFVNLIRRVNKTEEEVAVQTERINALDTQLRSAVQTQGE